MTAYKIGFACKLHSDKPNPFQLRASTVTSMTKLTKKQQREKVAEIALHNVRNVILQIDYIKVLPLERRMLRLSSDILPFFTHKVLGKHYTLDLMNSVKRRLEVAGKTAREHNIRLSFHPAQYTVLNSVNPQTVDNAIADIEYHTLMANMMGFYKRGEFNINIHGGSKEGGIKNWRKNFKRLSKSAKAMLTVENDEVSFGIEELLQLGDLVPVVLDLHHHWCHSKGKWLKPSSSIVKKVLKTWGKHRPKMHFSMCLNDYCSKGMPNYTKITKTVAGGKLRAHADVFTKDFAKYVAGFTKVSDLMCEMKHKQVAANQVYKIVGKL